MKIVYVGAAKYRLRLQDKTELIIEQDGIYEVPEYDYNILINRTDFEPFTDEVIVTHVELVEKTEAEPQEAAPKKGITPKRLKKLTGGNKK